MNAVKKISIRVFFQVILDIDSVTGGALHKIFAVLPISGLTLIPLKS